MSEVVVFGSLMIDNISYVDRFPRAGETLHSNSFEVGFGGKGANQAIAASRLGCKTAMIGKVGADPYGQKYRDQFDTANINTAFLETEGEHTGVALILVAPDGTNQIVINANANQYLSCNDVIKSKPLLDSSKVLICQLEVPLESTVKALTEFRGGLSILNAAPAMKLPDNVYKLPDIFCVNEHESEELTGIAITTNTSDAKKSIEILKTKGCKVVIITLGSLGAIFNDGERIIHVPIQSSVDAIDTVGAGDAFIGALAYFALKFPNASLIEKVGASIEIATHTVQFKGTQTSYIDFPSINPMGKIYKFTEI